MPEVVSDTSPIQYLFQCGLLDLLPRLYRAVLIPEAVAQELEVGRTRGIPLNTRTAVLDLAGEGTP